MEMHATPQDAPCGPPVWGLDLCRLLDGAQIAALRALWLEHLVLAFPDQDLAIEDIERFAQAWHSDRSFLAHPPADALPTELKGPCPLAIIDKRKIPSKEDT